MRRDFLSSLFLLVRSPNNKWSCSEPNNRNGPQLFSALRCCVLDNENVSLNLESYSYWLDSSSTTGLVLFVRSFPVTSTLDSKSGRIPHLHVLLPEYDGIISHIHSWCHTGRPLGSQRRMQWVGRGAAEYVSGTLVWLSSALNHLAIGPGFFS